MKIFLSSFIIKYYVVFFLLINSSYSFSFQDNNGESLKSKKDLTLANYYYSLGDSLSKNNKYEESLQYLKKASSIFDNIQNIDGYLRCLTDEATIFRILGKYQESLNFGQEIIDYSTINLGELNKWRAVGFNIKGNAYRYLVNYTDAIASHNKAISILEDLRKVDKELISAYNGLASVYYRLGDYQRALEYYEDNLNLSIKILEKDDAAIGTAINNVGIIKWKFGNYQEAIKYFKDALRIYKLNFGDSSLKVASSYNNIGTVYSSSSVIDTAIIYLNKAIDIRKKKFGEEHVNVLTSYMNIGSAYANKGDFRKSLEYSQNALDIGSKILPENHYLFGSLYSNIGKSLQSLGAGNQALTYHERALALNRINFGENSESVALSYSYIGVYYIYLGEFQLALDNVNNAINAGRKALGEFHPTVANAYRFAGIALRNLGRDDESLIYLYKSLNSFSGVYENVNNEIAALHDEFGQTYYKLDSIEASLASFEKSISIRKALLGPRYPYLTAYQGISHILQENGETDKALEIVQDGLITNSRSFSDISHDFNPKIEDVITEINTLELLVDKLKILEYNASEKSLLSIISTVQSCDTLIGNLRQSYQSYQDKVLLGELSYETYKRGIKFSYRLFELNKSTKDLNRAFYFSEKGKAEILKQSLNSSFAKESSGIPEDLITYENTLRYNISKLETKILDISNSDTTEKSHLNDLKKSLFEFNSSRDSVISTLEKKIPNYYQLKYSSSTFNVHDIQEKMNSNTAIIEYFLSDSIFYTFLITKNNYEVFENKLPKVLPLRTDSLRSNLIHGIESKDPFKSFNEFVSLSNGIYDAVLKDPMDHIEKLKGVNNLIIIPDGFFSYIPFEILLKDKGNLETGDYRKLNYLLKTYNISYGYSANLAFEEAGNQSGFDKINFLGYAPSYSEEIGKDSVGALVLGKFRNSVSPLKWNRKEVEEVGKLVQGNYFDGQSATETSFKENIEDYNVIHLAMHALIDDKDPMNSKLVFRNDSINDGFLFTHELLNMEMDPDLVVLSACNTGFGELKKGEGLMSLAYGFAYAGCPSTVASQWQVDDKSTSDLMQLFYENLSNGQAKNVALRNAKLSYLEEANATYAHPYYWGSFILIGDETSLIEKNQKYLYYVIPLALFLVLLIWYAYKKRLATT